MRWAPCAGRARGVARGTRELVMSPLPCIMVYTVHENAGTVHCRELRLLHEKRMRGSEPNTLNRDRASRIHADRALGFLDDAAPSHAMRDSPSDATRLELKLAARIAWGP